MKEFIDWLHEVEHVYKYEEILERMDVNLVAISIRGYASTWWEQLKQTRKR